MHIYYKYYIIIINIIHNEACVRATDYSGGRPEYKA